MKKEAKKKMKLKLDTKNIIMIICLVLFILLTLSIKLDFIDPIDDFIESFIIGIRNDKLTNIMEFITNIARAYSLIAISLILLFIMKNKKKALLIIINLVSVFLTSQLFKFIFRRSRPDGEFLVVAKGFSYPSGHAMVSTAYFSFITFLIYQNIKNKFLKTLLVITNVIVVLLIGFSRIYLGVHYFSDVLAGYLLSVAYLMIFFRFTAPKEEKA